MEKEVDISNQSLIRYFLANDYERVGDVLLEIRPLPSDIPVFDRHYYDSLKDNFVILFKCDEDPVENYLSENVSLFLEPSTMRIAGVKVSGVRDRGINTVTVSIQQSLDDYTKTLREKVLQAKKWNEKLRRVGQFDIEKRKLAFFSQEIPKTLSRLYAGA